MARQRQDAGRRINGRKHGYQRLFGIPTTRAPQDPGCWIYDQGMVQIDLSRTPELARIEGAVRLSGGDLREPLLVMRGADRRFHAFCNRCGHRGRCLDPIDGGRAVQCCSVGRSTYDFGGRVLSGPSCCAVKTYPVRAFGDKVQIRVLPRSEASVSARLFGPGLVRESTGR